MTSIERTKTISDIVATWAGLLALIGGGLFGLVQYLDKKSDDRVNSSMRLVERFHADHLQSSYLLLSATWQRNNQVVREAAFSTNGSDLPKLILTIIDSEGLARDIQTLIDFYEVLDVCVQQTICDSTIAENFFHKDALALFRNHSPYIYRERMLRNDATYACRLEQFALQRRASCAMSMPVS